MKQTYFISGLNVKDRSCWVIGDNEEAKEKAATLEKAGAKVTLLPKNQFKVSDLKDQFYVVFCDKDDPTLAKEIKSACEKKRILLCALDQPEFCDVVNVSLYERGALKIGISTSGVSPATAKKIRQGLEKSLKEEPLEDFFSYLSQLRAQLESEMLDPKERRKKLIEAVSDFSFDSKITLPKNWKKTALSVVAGIGLLLSSCAKKSDGFRVGYSPNLTHAQALVLTQEKSPSAWGLKQKIRGQVFHAGPSIIEALFAGELDVAYVGPIPALNSFLRSNGDFVVIAAGANGGGGLVVPKDSAAQSAADLKGKRVLTPQLGNTQDVTARAYFKEQGWDVSFYPVTNPDQINLFRKKDVDGAWTVEPWVSRLIHETGARLLFDEVQVWENWTQDPYPTTLLVARRDLVKEDPESLRNFLRAHIQVTQWIKQNPAQAKEKCNQALAHHLGKPLEEKTLDQAWDRIQFVWIPSKNAVKKNAENFVDVGFSRDPDPDLTNLFQLEVLNDVLSRT